MNNRLLALALTLVFFSACKTKKYSRNNKQIEKAANKANPDVKSYTTLNYIEAFKAVAVEEMNKYGIPASITLAQGIIESGSGNSSLAKYANNHFGIKCTSEWKGKAYYKDDDQANDCFRVYKDARESYKDHSEFLKRKRYSFLFELDKNDYKNWAYGLKQAGYATNPRYPDMLINVIDKYQLYQYDQPESERDKLKREDKVFTEINANIPNEKKKFTPVEVPPSKQVIKTPDTLKISAPVVQDTSAARPDVAPIFKPTSYTVKQGDTLYGISKRFNISIDELKTLNNLTDTGIKIGQKLVLVK
ncbi:glucosaminidase domain-containing protein [Pedobacter heparinus]|uniref:Peptidoglycan hydrolase n=1 Tax=Pedobacter heparinus (strain ATCC 13125 / DSM 2366 / CIP 104194 / JCM 7457 / NBRC 12017 / NCIMB 9290 / NRRL B-14731 / HIM 762-3) TaxID=485917 RepID=C6XXP3_PEDHD|nr:glucosaminidase domain-containing protein [Pedobacter heparinus]ACU02297.1 Mannosyl-glycoprotein endo-beta-N-acetylglucosamidase [Pedobacter heparinus DSM 2366]